MSSSFPLEIHAQTVLRPERIAKHIGLLAMYQVDYLLILPK